MSAHVHPPRRARAGVFLCALACLCHATVPARSEETGPQSPGTVKMAALLAQIRDTADPLRNPFRSSEQVPLLRSMLAESTDRAEQLQLRFRLASQLLHAGEIHGALKEYGVLLAAAKGDPVLEAEMVPQILIEEATCALRLAEVENCLGDHNPDSCLFPFTGRGVHRIPDGSRRAIAILSELLARSPRDLRARWLLNIAYMTLGEYPQKVPARWLIDPKLFASEYPLPRFHDVASAAGVAVNGSSGGAVLEDFDGDGLLDLMVSGWGLSEQLRFFHNEGNGSFQERTLEAGLVGEVGGLNLVHADFDNDGRPDVLVLRGGWLGAEGAYPCSLLRNQGDGTFADVTATSGISHRWASQSAAWLDYDGDGWLDLFIANESTEGASHPCELYRNNHDGTFAECAASAGVDFIGFFKGVTSGDFNNDGRPDLFLSSQDGPKLLLRNDGPRDPGNRMSEGWRFTDVAEAAGVTDPPSSFPCWFWDYDNDGWLDIMITGFFIQDVGDVAADYLGLPHAAQRARLYRNNGDGTFSDVSSAAGVDKVLLAMGCNFGDLDNDGWLDFYVGTGDPKLTTLVPNRMFRNDGSGRFQDVTTAGGFGQLQKGHAITFGDINNDGAQDVFSKLGGALEADTYPSQLFANPGFANNWLKLSLRGVTTNRLALGARIRVVVEMPDGTERSIHRHVGSGGSFGSETFRQEIGLGAARVIRRVEVSWPASHSLQTITGLEVNQAYEVVEHAPRASRVLLKRFAWPQQGHEGAAQ